MSLHHPVAKADIDIKEFLDMRVGWFVLLVVRVLFQQEGVKLMITEMDELSQVRLFYGVIFIVELMKQGAKPDDCFFLIGLRLLVGES